MQKITVIYAMLLHIKPTPACLQRRNIQRLAEHRVSGTEEGWERCTSTGVALCVSEAGGVPGRREGTAAEHMNTGGGATLT